VESELSTRGLYGRKEEEHRTEDKNTEGSTGRKGQSTEQNKSGKKPNSN
jgi:hypothetical protein